MAIADAASADWHHGGDPGRAARQARSLVPEGRWTSAQDYEVEGPDAGDSVMRVVYTPDVGRALSDPRQRVREIDLSTGTVKQWDRWPPRLTAMMLGAMALIATLAGLMFWRLSRPLRTSYEIEGRLAEKQILNDRDARELITRMQSRDA